jgi:hypothetical protein
VPNHVATSISIVVAACWRDQDECWSHPAVACESLAAYNGQGSCIVCCVYRGLRVLKRLLNYSKNNCSYTISTVGWAIASRGGNLLNSTVRAACVLLWLYNSKNSPRLVNSPVKTTNLQKVNLVCSNGSLRRQTFCLERADADGAGPRPDSDTASGCLARVPQCYSD